MRWRAKTGVSGRNTTIARYSIAVGIMLGIIALWSPASRYFINYTRQWRVWIAAIACIMVIAGIRVLATRHSRPENTGQHGPVLLRVPAEPGQEPVPPLRPPRDWVALSASSLPGLAAVIALIFTALSVQATKGQLQSTQQQLLVTEQGQITDRYNAAITNLGSASIDMRLGGIYALQRLMQDSPRDQPTVIAVLAAFVRDRSARGGDQAHLPVSSPTSDIQAALAALGARHTGNDGPSAFIDLSHASLAGAQLENLYLSGASLAGTDITSANLNSTHLDDANLVNANLADATLSFTSLADANLSGASLAMTHPTNVDLAGASFTDANLTGAVLANVNLAGASFFGANLSNAVLAGESLPRLNFAAANLTGADFSGADLTDGYFVAVELGDGSLVHARLSGTDFTGADLSGADIRSAGISYANLSGVNAFAADLSDANLTYANLTDADLTDADLTNANLTDANLTGARLRAANFTDADLMGVYWPRGALAPDGWRRNPGSGRLERAGRQPGR
jgi:uncharacterized protein YjbI with pentapeptide repeats